MKNTNKVPESYQDAIKNKSIEYATLDGAVSGSRKRCIKIANTLLALEKRGIELPDTIPGALADALVTEIETRGINIPFVPYDSLSGVECRAFLSSFTGKTEGLQTMVPPLKSKYKPSDHDRFLWQQNEYFKRKKI